MGNSLTMEPIADHDLVALRVSIKSLRANQGTMLSATALRGFIDEILRLRANVKELGRMTLAQHLALEGTAAQLYERSRLVTHSQCSWAGLKADVQDRYRIEARRKLKTGEIAGWPK